MSHLTTLTSLSAILLASTLLTAGEPDFQDPQVQVEQEKLNLLIIQTDEHNFRTLGCYRETLSPEQAFMWGEGAVVLTPNIDRIAQEGAICTSFYATSPVCSPSRAAMMSGRYPQNTAVVSNDIPMSDDVVTFAESLRREGWMTGFAGKWHLDGTAKPGWAPARDFGFTDNRYMFNRGHWKQFEDTDDGPRVKASDQKGKPSYAVQGADPQSFSTDFLTDRAIDFIEEHGDEPFCYMLSLPDPHGPDTVRPPYDTMYAGQEYVAPRTYDVSSEDAPPWAQPKGKFQSMAKYFGMVRCIDDNVGRILETLEQKGLLDRTIVIFTSDHGDLRGEHHRQNKGVPYEASAKVPFLMRLPSAIPAGTRIDEALGMVDFLPTILSLMDVPTAGLEEGRDASILFQKGSPPEHWQDIAIMRQAGRKGEGWLAAVDDRFKLVVAPDAQPWLLDLEQDPDELINFYSDPQRHADVVRLAQHLLHYGAESGDSYVDVPTVKATLLKAVFHGETQKEHEATRPNIVLMMAEDMCPDLSCYGNDVVSTPNLDRLASQGVRFDKAFTTSPVCSPSRSAMMVGVHQSTIGAHQHRTQNKAPLPSGVKTIVEHLRDAGYHTILGGLGSGKTDLNFIVAKDVFFHSKKWDDRPKDKPFFMQLTFNNTHRKWGRDEQRPIDAASIEVPPYYPDHPLVRRDIANGLEEIQVMDRLAGKVLDRLEKEKLLDNTLVIFIGDHGRCQVRGKQFLYDSGLHVPLIMRWPDKIEAGSERGDLVSSIDVSAAILAAAKVELPEYLHGQNVLNTEQTLRSYVFAARGKMDDTHDAMRAVRSDTHKYILNLMPERAYCQFNKYKENSYPVLALLNVMNLKGELNPTQALFMAPTKPEIELYDLRTDPFEIHNLAGKPEVAEVEAQLRAELDRWRKQINDQGVSEEFRAGGWPAVYPTRTLEEWQQLLDRWLEKQS
ncbi:MAG: sulfatase-like hydrolase/transferase [Planctomycetes bacterium]|nr:sulfatase-like hydrolase/transferase [Planctomycetota bacterium]MCP4770122.1 sulfatase-like hydrolase/transferase [Planctomycetota bacterium]MCP4860730.1 sulfatase-like hydrolase/transferase [Planctomycetota bacterium]